MFDVVKKAIRRLFPELFAGYHLPKLARVVAVADAPAVPGIVDEFRPRFAVDIRILTAAGLVDDTLPLFKAVPLPVAMAGLDQGHWGFPQPGAIVEVAFAYGNPAKPFIRTVLSTGQTSPAVNNGDMLWQHSPGVYQSADTAGNWQRHTDKRIHDQSTVHQVDTVHSVQNYHHHQVNVDTNSTETIGGTKAVEAMGALRLLAGEQALLLALQELKLASKTVLKTYSEGNTEMHIGAELQALATSLAHIQAPKVWLGSESVNVAQVLLDLIGVVKAIATTLENHTHGGPPPDQKGDFTGQKNDAGGLQDTLSPIVE
ncbi:hypothetical protein [Bowmanella denitrificans]|uniref:hypothetical protein n=1 Tax=Bowmanella denitrificans TaxID=366582 RepID=UPI000C9A6DFE|nr:hypothetical protein [Bowmanella denitrificans]